jgi:hypothetical protein
MIYYTTNSPVQNSNDIETEYYQKYENACEDDLEPHRKDEKGQTCLLEEVHHSKLNHDPSYGLTLSEEACDALIKGCEYGRKWINSDFLWGLARKDNGISDTDACVFFNYEDAVLYNGMSFINDFRCHNPQLDQFCDFFERELRKGYGITAETDQVTSN